MSAPNVRQLSWAEVVILGLPVAVLLAAVLPALFVATAALFLGGVANADPATLYRGLAAPILCLGGAPALYGLGRLLAATLAGRPFAFDAAFWAAAVAGALVSAYLFYVFGALAIAGVGPLGFLCAHAALVQVRAASHDHASDLN